MIGAAVGSSPSRSFRKRHAVTRLRLDRIAEVIFVEAPQLLGAVPADASEGVRASLVQG
jgi:hypothetical protein